jgi:putative ABC transport system permease protein
MRPLRRRSDEDFAREIEAHVALETERLIADGMSPADARHAAIRRFGNGTQTRERFYESRRILWLDELRHDVRYAFRALRRAPGFAAVALVTLAIGIGANTAIFSVVNAVILRPLPYHEPSSLVLIQAGEIGLTPGWAAAAWRERSRTLTDFAAFSGPSAATLVADGQPAEIDVASVTWNFLSFLGTPPIAGRDFTAEDVRPGAPPVAVLSHDCWMTRFGGEASVLGRTIMVTGTPVTVIGVAPSGFRFPTSGALPAYGLPIDTQPDVIRAVVGTRAMNVLGRLAPGVNAAAANRELLTIYRQSAAALLDDGQPEFSAEQVSRLTLDATPLQERLSANVRQRLWLAMGAVAFVLLVACANVANLLLVRASARERELVLRTALGARRGRLARLLLTESVLLAALGSGGGLLIAYATRGVARTLLADRIPHVGDVGIDLTVLAFTIAVAVTTGVLAGLVTLQRVRRVSLTGVFNESGTHTVTGRGVIRSALLSTEIAVTFVLVVGAALFAQTLWTLTAQDKGFDPDRMLTVRVAPGVPPTLDRTSRQAAPAYWAGFFADLSGRFAELPGVEAVGGVSVPPLGGGVPSGLLDPTLDGQRVPGPESRTAVEYVTPGYFEAMRIPIVAGRDFTERDRPGSELVAIVNESFQRRFAPNRNIIGARLRSASGPETFTIVGVMRDVPDWSLRQAPEPLLAAPVAQMPNVHISWGALTYVLRTADRDPLRIAPEVRRTVWAINPNIVVNDIATMNQRVAIGWRAERDSAVLFGMFAIAALVMAAIGVYGVAAYALVQRTREIGIRVALGAAHAEVRRLVVRQTIAPTMIGILVGIAAATGLTQLVASMMYGVTPLDPPTFVGGVLVLVAVALAATWAPARRATLVDPLTALRYE